MNDANQVRINELARELEVKAKAIIDLLPGYGVTEKKTHSSSIPVDVAEKVRKKLAGGSDGEDEVAATAPAKSVTRDAAPQLQLRPAVPVSGVPAQTIAHPATPSTIPAPRPIAPASPAVPGSAALGSSPAGSATSPSIAPSTHSPLAPARPTAPPSAGGASLDAGPSSAGSAPVASTTGGAPTAPASPRPVATAPAAAPLRPGAPAT